MNGVTVSAAQMPCHHLLPVIILSVVVGLALLASAGGAAAGEQFVYNGFAGANLTVDGSATVTPGGLVELTNGTTHAKGHAFHPSPLRLRGPPPANGTAAPATAAVRSFSVSFVFGIVSSYLDFSTHGLALVFVPSTDLSAALTDQYLGLTNTEDDGRSGNRMLAVELDTVQNIEFRDISANHVGIDVNSLASVASHDAGYYTSGSNGSSFQNLSLISRQAMQVWVDYDGGAARVDVTMAPLGAARPVTPLLSAAVNLSAVLAEPSFVGFSSATGPATNSRHYVLGWSLGTHGSPAPPLDAARLPALSQVLPPPPPPSSDNKRARLLETVLPVASAAVVLAAGAAAVLLVRRRRRFAEVREDWEREFGPHRFAYKDLFIATGGFRDDGSNLLGAGGFGMVFRGVLRGSGVEVAVKKVSHGSRQGMKEFVAEIVSIGRIRHRSLVRLLGYCRRRDELILVYDYMPNGSLDRYIHGGNGGPAAGAGAGGEPPATEKMDWERRFRVMRDVAAGLHYLHERWEKVVVHRDIKASNVLLDGEMNARLGDFGLAKLYERGDADRPATTRVVGTTGYLAPELVRTGKATPRTDVFAFGTLVLEVTTGRRPICGGDGGGDGQTTLLADWVLRHWHGETLAEAIDPRLRGGGGGEFAGEEEACLALKVGLLCSHPSPEARPSMQQVMQYLDGEAPLPEMTRAELSFDVLPLVQSKGLHLMSCACSTSTSTAISAGTISDLSGGR